MVVSPSAPPVLTLRSSVFCHRVFVRFVIFTSADNFLDVVNQLVLKADSVLCEIDQVLYVPEMNVSIQWINLSSLIMLHVMIEILFFLLTTIAYNTRIFTCVVLHMFRCHEIEFNTWFLTGLKDTRQHTAS